METKSIKQFVEGLLFTFHYIDEFTLIVEESQREKLKQLGFWHVANAVKGEFILYNLDAIIHEEYSIPRLIEAGIYTGKPKGTKLSQAILSDIKRKYR